MLIPFGLLVQQPIIESANLKIIGASLFKNGYSVITREADIQGSGEYILENFPQAALGTLWLTASPGVGIEEAMDTTLDAESEWSASSMDDVLSLAVGKRVGLVQGDKPIVSGELQGAAGQIVIVKTSAGTQAIPKNLILSVIVDGEIEWKKKVKSQRRAIRVKVHANGAGKLYTLSLERGMAWVPSYAIDITDSKNLTLVAKATVMNDLQSFENADLQFVTGFPNLPYLNFMDPFGSNQDVSSFTNGMMNLGFGGGGLRREDARSMMQNAAPAADFGSAFEPTGQLAGQQEDLFFYKQPKVSMKSRDRGYFVLFQDKSQYKHVYTWDIPDAVASGDVYQGESDSPPDIWHSLKFKNTGKQPYTTGIALTLKNGELIGQDMLKYTGVGTEATVQIAKALEIQAESKVEEVDRKVEQIVMGTSKTSYFLVTMKSSMSVQNRKSEPATIVITKYLTGEVLSADGDPKIEKMTKGMRDVNARAKLQWEKTINPGEKLSLTMTHKVYLRAG